MPRKSVKKERSKAPSSPIKAKVSAPKLLRGMRDIMPSEQKYWKYIRNAMEKLAYDYGFKRIDTPVLEETALFKRGVGANTDIVEKEMFSFADRGGSKVSLCPEGTASIARAYIEHGMRSMSQPVKLYYIKPLFRYERPQKGRYRQHFQVGFESFGSGEPVIDAQLILMARNFFKEMKIEVDIQINSIGCSECREEYKKALLYYYKPKKNLVCADCQKRAVKNPLRLLDCKKERCRQAACEAPQLVDNLCDPCKKHFVKVLEHLDEAETTYILNPMLVRGLDYYNGTVFEIFSKEGEKKPESKGGKEESAAMALGGGGRYDRLIEMIGGQPAPACGFACGVERMIERMKASQITVPGRKKYDIYLAQLGESGRKRALKVFEDLRKSGVRVVENLSKGGLRAQLEQADKLGVKLTLILGQKEVLEDTILIRDMESGVQEVVPLEKIGKEIKKRLKK